ncbi:hypothetical protein [Streptomyces sp. NPDC047525]|uniref:hypothetical protein n=1 Tax=Streptomyces sp. NPDC047525 TaxID=3155264 RepID=UPI0033CFA09E
MAMNVVGLVGWIVTWVALLAALAVYLSPGYVPLLLPFMMLAFYRSFTQLAYFPWAVRMRRILQQYPWQVLDGVERGLGEHPGSNEKGPWFAFSNPAKPEEKIPLVFLRTMRRYWWTKRIGGSRTKPELKAQIEPLWFAGDPRFLAVIAAPGREGKAPKRKYVLHQRAALDRRIAPFNWGASARDVERARRAGARVADHDNSLTQMD